MVTSAGFGFVGVSIVFHEHFYSSELSYFGRTQRMSSSQKFFWEIEYWKIKGTEYAINGTQIAFKWVIDSVTI